MRANIVLLLVCILAVQLFGQSSQAPVSSDFIRQNYQSNDCGADAQIAYAAMLKATGWNRAPVAVAAQLSSVDSDGHSATANLQAAQGNRFRSDSSSPTCSRTLIIKGTRAAILSTDGVEHLPVTFALSATPNAFPYLNDLLSGRAAVMHVCKLGFAQLNGERVLGLQLRRTIADTEPFARLRKYTDQLIVWISAASNLPLAIDRTRVALGNYDAGVTIRTLFSDYQSLDGIAVPLTYREQAVGQVVFTGRLQQVRLLTTTTDSEFTIPVAQSGRKQ